MKTYVKATPSRAVVEACNCFRDRKLRQLLSQDIPWQSVRRRVLGLGFLASPWRARSGGRAMRLTRYGLEFRENGIIRRYSWKDIQNIAHRDRS